MESMYVMGWHTFSLVLFMLTLPGGEHSVYECSGFPIKELGLFVKYVLRFCTQAHRRCWLFYFPVLVADKSLVKNHSQLSLSEEYCGCTRQDFRVLFETPATWNAIISVTLLKCVTYRKWVKQIELNFFPCFFKTQELNHSRSWLLQRSTKCFEISPSRNGMLLYLYYEEETNESLKE